MTITDSVGGLRDIEVPVHSASPSSDTRSTKYHLAAHHCLQGGAWKIPQAGYKAPNRHNLTTVKRPAEKKNTYVLQSHPFLLLFIFSLLLALKYGDNKSPTCQWACLHHSVCVCVHLSMLHWEVSLDIVRVCVRMCWSVLPASLTVWYLFVLQVWQNPLKPHNPSCCVCKCSNNERTKGGGDTL